VVERKIYFLFIDSCSLYTLNILQNAALCRIGWAQVIVATLSPHRPGSIPNLSIYNVPDTVVPKENFDYSHFPSSGVLHSSPNIFRVIKSRIMRWAGHVARMGERRGVYRVLVGKPERKRPLGRPRHRWEDNIKMDL
jgi:hypothetical protein